ncbi:FAD-dependent oxidoreductase [Campylobacter hepaticus]|uniref:glycerol-3-phosphate dehydrogenase/oxidase n=1 Tax=Campylobacter hepaticus TaxID=1813019 RepID=UPI0022A78B54|nr:FAD-dependent oxidoreductase [Campylobacter hepaticus]MCZ0771729.1 FAD-dependent oxidoreductase [Campylobacter hepaticus]MCZ0773037.1 FAD-dependent oxidoreductase [Campylobacter hepaticus]MCZ0773198.1 FAD-dependent oxidoreductase [Campylobacter hepaticus]MCZ0775877.1 FAD-dependent oxidoreductase [Campylobacter hepaticus]WAP50335.1 FAD-dependent oxidoreductase [Campylobacter hepaticus]
MKKEELQFGVSYYDACFDDARMAFSLAKTAYEFGACVLNYMNVTRFIKDDKGILKGLYVFDELNQKEFKINAKCIINATGVFSSEILRMDSSPSDIVPSQGIHIVVNKEFFPNENALIIPATSDGRVLFAIPWYDKVLIGTTDTKIEKVTYEPKALEEEIEFILENVAKYFEKKPKREDIKSIFVGLRPLINDANKDTKNLSRSHKIEVSKSNLISINGGKWTTCRIMAEQTINKAIDLALLSDKKCKSKDIKLSTYDKNLTFGERLSVYGLDAKAILNLEVKGLDKKIHKNYPYTYAQVFWALEEEMAQKIEYVLARRMR